MKKFNPEKEIEKLNKQNNPGNSSKLSNLFVPILVVACSCMAMTAVTFSAYLTEGEKETYHILINIINGDVDKYEKDVIEGAFSDTIKSVNSFGSINCTSGSLNYDPITQTISTPYLNRNTSCVIVFQEDGAKNLEPSGLNKINDNKGKSYYYKADAENNYVLIKDIMFRIVRINGDGTVRLVLNDNLPAVSFGETNDYYNSNIKKTLEEWYQLNFANEDYVVARDFDTTNHTDLDIKDLVNLEGYYEAKVGTLSAREIKLITDDTAASYLQSINGIYTANASGVNNIYAYKNGKIESVQPTEVLNIRPVININAKLIGNGTLNNPYTISK